MSLPDRVGVVSVASMIAAAALGAGCGGSPKKTAEPTRAGETRRAPSSAAERAAEAAPAPTRDAGPPGFDPLYFDFDTAVLSPRSLDTLDRLAGYLSSNDRVVVIVQGHADERGTDEYNVALGDRRARAARDHLIRLGVAPTRLQVISYGEERPAVAGNDESAWARNRRDELVVELDGGHGAP